MKKVLSLVLSLVMLLGLVVPVSAEDTIFEGNGTLKDKTVAFTIEPDKTTLYGGGEQIVKFHIYAKSVDNVPIRAFQFTLVPSANLTLADKTMAEDGTFYYACQSGLSTNGNPDGMYSQIAYTPGSRYFGAAGTDEDKGITARTEVMTIMGKVNGVGDYYTLSMTGVVAGNGDAPNKVTQRFTSTVAGATVTVKPESARPQPNLSLALSTGKVKVGDTFTATLTNKGMNIISIIAQMRFNKDVLEVVSITENEGYANLASGAAVKVRPTVDEANTNGVVGMSIVNTAESWYPAKDIVTVTFKAKAAGEGWFELYESTDGTNGYLGDNSGGTVTVEAAAVTGVTVSGTVKSYGSETENVTVTLTPENGTPMTTVVTGNSAAYKFENVSAGTYTLKVEKANHVAREYKVTVSGDAVQQDAKVCLRGDVNMDGAVDIGDHQTLFEHLQGINLITDEYQLKTANVNQDNAVDIGDHQTLFEHLQGITRLF